jgi:hypothetical protein
MTSSSGNQPNPSSLGSWHGWKLVVVTVALSAVVIVVVSTVFEKPAPPVPSGRSDQAFAPRALPLPLLNPNEKKNPKVEYVFEMGIPVYRIRTNETGDEIIVVRSTGKLLAVRDYEGKTIWGPMLTGSPKAMSDPPVKGS